MSAKVFKSPFGEGQWFRAEVELRKNGVRVFRDAKPADCSIVLSGQNENPLSLTGKKILFFHKLEWKEEWPYYKTLLEEYYDEFVDVTDTTLEEFVSTLKSYINDQGRQVNKS